MLSRLQKTTSLRSKIYLLYLMIAPQVFPHDGACSIYSSISLSDLILRHIVLLQDRLFALTPLPMV